MNDWLQTFYTDPEVRAAVLAAYRPVFEKFAIALGRVTESGNPDPLFVEAVTLRAVDDYLTNSRIELQTIVSESPDPAAAIGQRFDDWDDGRPSRFALTESVRFENAVALQQFRDSGAIEKRWRTNGSDTCEYCSGLDGTVVGIERPFFSQGDSFQPAAATRPLTFSHDIGHPPAHPGCDCSIDAA